MPHQELSHRFQKAVLWPAVGIDGYGQPTIGAPVELRVRWDDSQREVLDAQGNTIAIDATVIVDRDIPLGSVMWRGGLGDLGPGTAYIPPSDVMLVKIYDATPDIRNRVNYRTVSLMRLKDTLPTRMSV